MAPGVLHRAHVGDLVREVPNRQHVGVIYRTHADNHTNTPEPLMTHTRGIDRHPGISPAAYGDFLASGAPPPDTCLVLWSHDFARQDGDVAKAELLPIGEIEVIERPVFIGDIVRKSPQDSMSGTVVSIDVKLGLTNPRPLPSNNGDSYTRPSLNMAGCVDDVAAEDLVDTVGFTTGQVIIYKGWVGRILDYTEAVHVLLADGSVVEVENPEDLLNDAFLGEDVVCIGDYVHTKKGNLRRGHFIHGSYNANTAPEGYVVDVRIQEAEIRWTANMHSGGPDAPPPVPPPSSLLRDELESHSCVIYDRSRQPEVARHSSRFPKVLNIDIGVGDKMRFRDLSLAKQKYPAIKAIDRGDCHGYDLNVFSVYTSRTMATVLWQDLSISTHHSLELLPSSDLDDGNELWPGEVVLSRSYTQPPDENGLVPDGIGIVQSVKTRDQLARVKWLAGMTMAMNDGPVLIAPHSWIGRLKDDDPHDDNSAMQGGDDMSMYDLRPDYGMQRRIGDIVAITPPRPALLHSTPGSPYDELHHALDAPLDQLRWLGEVIELSTHGWLVVRLGASTTGVRDIRVPWDCTVLACGDQEEDMPWSGDEDLSNDEDDDDYFDDELEQALGYASDSSYDTSHMVHVPWTDENDREVAEGEPDWETDDDDDDGEKPKDEDGDVVMSDEVPPSAEPLAPPVKTDLKPPTDKFSYELLFSSPDSPEQFAVLDGTPAEHHYLAESVTVETKRLRRIQKEFSILQSSLPPGVFVRTWEGNTSLLRILILGPLGTPYEYAPFIIDMHLGAEFPNQPPSAFFHSWTDGSGNVNPNLYEDGKICLSLLGTWPGDSSEDTWTSKSTVLQVIVSILGLVLVKEPWYNEAGFEVRAGTAESQTPSALYSERVFIKSRRFIEKGLTLAKDSALAGFDDMLHKIYLEPPRLLLRRAIAHAIGVANRSLAAYKAGQDVYADAARQEKRLVSAGAVRSLTSTTTKLFELCRGQQDDDGVLDMLKHTFRTLKNSAAAVDLAGDVAEYIGHSGG